MVSHARDPEFYAGHGVPDTLDGRFELIALHLFLVLHRLRDDAAAGRFGQALFDRMFADMDRALREMGTGDLSVGRQVKRMAQGFYGRAAAYQAGLAGERPLEEALARNLFGTVAEPDPAALAWFAAYLRRQAAALSRVPTATIAEGTVPFAPIGAAS